MTVNLFVAWETPYLPAAAGLTVEAWPASLFTHSPVGNPGAYPPAPSPAATTTTDASGNCELTGLTAATDYYVSIIDQNNQPWFQFAPAAYMGNLSTSRRRWSINQGPLPSASPSGGWTKIATITGDGVTNPLKFLNASTPWTSYKHLLVIGVVRSTAAGFDGLIVGINGNVTTNWAMNGYQASGAVIDSLFLSAPSAFEIFSFVAGGADPAGQRSSFELLFTNVNDAAHSKSMIANGSGRQFQWNAGGDYQVNTAITEIDLKLPNAVADSSSVYELYGL